MAKVYISPSTQDTNPVAGGGNEEQYMRAICTEACRLLVAAGHLVKMGGSISWQNNVADANAWGAQWYVAVHSNAGGGHGSEGYFYTGSTLGKKLCTTVYNRVAAASNEPDRGIKSNTTFGELRGPKAPACLVETLFHDCPKEAAELKTSIKEFGRAIAQGVVDTIGGKLPAPAPTPAPPTTTTPAPTTTAVWRISSQDADTIVLRRP